MTRTPVQWDKAYSDEGKLTHEELEDMEQTPDKMILSLREAQRAFDEELLPLLQAETPDWSMLIRLRDVADEHAARARHLRRAEVERGTDAGALDDLNQLCEYFDRSASLIAQETGDADESSTFPGDKPTASSRG